MAARDRRRAISSSASSSLERRSEEDDDCDDTMLVWLGVVVRVRVRDAGTVKDSVVVVNARMMRALDGDMVDLYDVGASFILEENVFD